MSSVLLEVQWKQSTGGVGGLNRKRFQVVEITLLGKGNEAATADMGSGSGLAPNYKPMRPRERCPVCPKEKTLSFEH